MSEYKENKKGKWKQFLYMAGMMLVGAVGGGLAAKYLIERQESGGGVKEAVLWIGGLLLMFIIASYVQIIVHEAGHLVFGKLTGYEFSSFRIGSLMIIRQNGKLQTKRFSLAGTGGQCLMIPPEMKDGKIPVVWYNLGGAIMNILAGILGIFLYRMFEPAPVLALFWMIFAGFGFLYALVNGIPMRIGMIDNDGYNALSLGKNEEAMRSFWIQLMANAEIAKGVRLKDMPKEWFTVPSYEGMKNSIVAIMGVFACSRLMDEHSFEEAERLMKHLLSMDTAINGLHRNLMKCDLIYCELLKPDGKEAAEKLLNKELRSFMKSMKNYISVLRNEYVFSLFLEEEEEKANGRKEKFEKVALTYPYESDVESERELMEIAFLEKMRRKDDFLKSNNMV